MANEFQIMIERAKDVMLNPAILYKYDDIVLGVSVCTNNGNSINMWAVSQNTWRGFRNIESPSEIYKLCFLENKDMILNSLEKVDSYGDLNILENKLYDMVLPKLLKANKNPASSILDSYNKVRKPIDLYIEHLVLMSKELDTRRRKLISYLMLPLDSWIFETSFIFTEDELSSVGLNRGSKYGDLKDRSDYNKLQALLKEKAEFITEQIKLPFYRIYFDMFWNNRYKRNGRNLFETNK